MNPRPLRKLVPAGDAPFFDTPDELALYLCDKVVPHAEAGWPYLGDRLLTHLEAEAVARFRHGTGYAPTHEPDKRAAPDLWRIKWVCEAQYAEGHLRRFDAVTQAAIRVLTTCSKLRYAMADGDKPELIAALGMLLMCEVIEGGFSLAARQVEHELGRTKTSLSVLEMSLEEAHRPRQEAYRRGIGKEADDLKQARDLCVEHAASWWQRDPDLGMSEVADKLVGVLREHKSLLPMLSSFPKATTIKTWLKGAHKAGELDIPAAARRPGRRPKAG